MNNRTLSYRDFDHGHRDFPEASGDRDMESVDRDSIMRAIYAVACRAGLGPGDFAVLLAVLARTLTWRRLSDRVTHSVLKTTAPVGRPGRHLKKLLEVGLLVHYRPGFDSASGAEFSEIVLRIPRGWRAYAAGVTEWSEGEGGYGSGDPQGMAQAVHLTTRTTTRTPHEDVTTRT